MKQKWMILAAALAVAGNVAAQSGRLAVSGNTVLALRSDGTLVAWGDNQYGQYGSREYLASDYPVNLKYLDAIAQIDLSDKHAVALRRDGTVWEWGNEIDPSAPARRPVAVAGLAGVKQIAAGPAFGMALKSDGGLWHWDSLVYPSYTAGAPRRVDGLPAIKTMAACGKDALALDAAGSLWTWTSKYDGLSALSPLQRLSGLAGVTDIAGGPDCQGWLALDRQGEVWWWKSMSEPGWTLVSGAVPPVQKLGKDHVLAGKSGSVWGWNSSQEIGERQHGLAGVTEVVRKGDSKLGLQVLFLTANGDLYEALGESDLSVLRPQKMIAPRGDGLLNLDGRASPADSCEVAVRDRQGLQVEIPCLRFDGKVYQLSLKWAPEMGADVFRLDSLR